MSEEKEAASDVLESEAVDNNEQNEALLQQRLERCQRETAGTELDLSNLQLTDFPSEVAVTFPSVRRLNLRNNRIDVFPNDFARCFPQLAVLNAAGNALTHLPEHFGALGSLQKLSLADNRLEELPPSFSHLHLLEDLNLAGNQLCELDEEVGNQLLKLKNLDLSRNPRLREIPSSFGLKLTMLRVVDLSGNDDLVAVPDKIRRLHERNVILHSRAKRRELISRALRVRHAVGQTMLNAAIVNPVAAGKKAAVK